LKEQQYAMRVIKIVSARSSSQSVAAARARNMNAHAVGGYMLTASTYMQLATRLSINYSYSAKQ